MSRLTLQQLEMVWQEAELNYENTGEASGNTELWHEFAMEAAEELFGINPKGYRDGVMNDYCIKREELYGCCDDSLGHIPFEADIDPSYLHAGCHY